MQDRIYLTKITPGQIYYDQQQALRVRRLSNKMRQRAFNPVSGTSCDTSLLRVTLG